MLGGLEVWGLGGLEKLGDLHAKKLRCLEKLRWLRIKAEFDKLATWKPSGHSFGGLGRLLGGSWEALWALGGPLGASWGSSWSSGTLQVRDLSALAGP